ncbi:MAG: hypothetical protein J1E31_06750 [Helicobacter sp.]|nr:hypothetical protein [Helicobacter sp.]
MATLLFAYSIYNAPKAIYEQSSLLIREKFSAYKPDVFLNNPEYLIFTIEGEDWQKEFVALVGSLKKHLNAFIESYREQGNPCHIVYRFGLLEMQSTLFQYPADLEDDDDDEYQ